MTALAEADVEDAALEWLAALGWQTAHGPDIGPGGTSEERADYGAVVLERRLRDALARLNPDLPSEALDGAYRKLTRPEGSVKSQGALRKRSWGSRRDRWASRRSHLREQRTPTRRKEPPLLSERHRVASPAAPAEVLPQLVERRAEARRRREAPEAAHRVVPLLQRAMVLLHEVV